MADRVSASITIGGTLPRSLLDRFVQIVCDERLSLDWEGTAFAFEDILPDAPVKLVAHEVAWGSFSCLESFCQEHGLAYVRRLGGCPGSFGPERVVFTGQGDPTSHAVTENDELVFDLEAIRTLGGLDAIEARAGEAAFTPGPLVIAADPGTGTEARHG